MSQIESEKKRVFWHTGLRLSQVAIAFALVFGVYASTFAFEIDTGNNDYKLRLDTALRYNYGVRVKSPNKSIIGNANIDDGDRNFNKGTVTNRLDIVPELDFSYKDLLGFRFSGAAWYDQRYHDPLGNDSVATSNHLVNGNQSLGLDHYTKRYHAGPEAELLDAFVFGRLDLGPVPVNIKVGRHTVYWGESLTFNGVLDGICYSQMPIDAAKAFATPGSEARELFRPLSNVSAQAQLTNGLSIAAQYFLEWEPFRLPEAGSYLNNADVLAYGGESLILAPGVLFPRGDDIEPKGTKNWGAMARWTPEWLGGGGTTIGLYYRNFADMLPQLHVDLAAGQYFAAYADDIELYGISLAKEILGVSVGAELSYRHNTPLVSEAAVMLPGTSRPARGETLGARGDTWHGVINFLGLLPKTSLYDIASWTLELTWARWDRVTQGEQYFLGRDGYNNIDRVSKDAMAISANFSPTWYQVFPSMDLSMPLSYSRGLTGNSALVFGDNKNAGNWSGGLSLDVYQKYNFTLQYIGFFGDFDTGPTGAVTFNRGTFATMKDRDMVAFTFKTSF